MTRGTKILALKALATGSLMMSATGSISQAAPPAPAATAVRIGNFTFDKAVVTVKPGTTVTWTNGDDIPHTIVAKNGSFRSKPLDSGDRFSFTFAKPGQFGYFCSIHPHMTGTIIVKA